MKRGRGFRMKERLDLINKIQTYLKENKKDGLLIYEIGHSEPYFNALIGVPCSTPSLLYIHPKDKPKCIVSNLELPAVKSTGLFEEKNLLEYNMQPFAFKARELLKDLKGKNILVNFSETDPLVDQVSHDFVTGLFQGINIESSEDLWKYVDVKRKEKEYAFDTSLKVRKTRIKNLKNKLAGGSFIMVNGVGVMASETYASYLMSFLKNQKYAIAVNAGKAIAIVHKDEKLCENLFDKVLTYENTEEFQKRISECFKDVEKVHYDNGMTEGNYRLLKKILDKKLQDSSKNLIDELLAVKLPEEIKEMEKACKINDELFDYLEEKLETGMSEKQISNLIKEKALSYSDVLGLSFPSLIAAGENGANIHHFTSDYKVQKGDLLLVDIGVRLKTGMGSDTTCMFYFGNAIPERIKEYDRVMDESMLAVEKSIGPGKSKMDADSAARAVIKKHYPDFEHGAGHGVDLKCHGKSDPMMPSPQGFFGIGEVFTIEPGIYITKKHVPKKYPKAEGYRKEIMVQVTKKGTKRISEIPKLRLIRR